MELKILISLYCSLYLGFLGYVWNSTDFVDRYFKIINISIPLTSISTFLIGTILGLNLYWILDFPVGISGLYGILFFLADSQKNRELLLFKFLSLTTFLIAIIYFLI